MARAQLTSQQNTVTRIRSGTVLGVGLGLLGSVAYLYVAPIALSGSLMLGMTQMAAFMLSGAAIGGFSMGGISAVAAGLENIEHSRAISKQGKDTALVSMDDLSLEHVVKDKGSKQATYVKDRQTHSLHLKKRNYDNFQEMVSDNTPSSQNQSR